jgi:hypothetical protein
MTEEFSYTLEDEKILEYLKLPTEDKLNWLEEILEFNKLVLGETNERYIVSLESTQTEPSSKKSV